MLFYTLLMTSLMANAADLKTVSNTSQSTEANLKPGAPVTKVMSIKDVVTTALANNPSLKTQREKVNQYAYLTSLTRSALFPNLSLSGSAGSAQAALSSGNPPLFNGTMYNQYGTTLTLTQPLFAFGAMDAVDRSDYDRKVQVTAVEIAERTLTTNVVSSFYNIILNERLLNYLIESKKVLEKSLETTVYREKIGRAQLLDVLQVKTQIASIQPQIDTARNTYETAAAQLASFMGVSGKQSEIAIRGTLKTLFLKDLEKHVDYKNYYLPELEANRLQIAQIQDAKNADQGQYLPILKATGNYVFASYTASDLYSQNNNSWNAQLVLTIPIFEGLASKYDASNYASQELQLYSSRRDLENTLNLNQITSRKSMETAETSLASATEADRLAKQSLAEATRQYRLATIDFLNYLTIQNTAFTAASTLDQIRYNSITACANYFVASGQPLSILIDLLSQGE